MQPQITEHEVIDQSGPNAQILDAVGHARAIEARRSFGEHTVGGGHKLLPGIYNTHCPKTRYPLVSRKAMPEGKGRLSGDVLRARQCAWRIRSRKWRSSH